MKTVNKIEAPIDLWKTKKPTEGKEMYLWEISLLNAVKNGFVASEIQEGKLTQDDISKIKYNAGSGYYGSMPKFYEDYATLLDERNKIERERTLFLTILVPKPDKPVTIGDVFFYDKASNSIKNKSGETFWIGTVQSSQLDRNYDLKTETEIKPDTNFIVTDRTKSGASYYLQAPVRSEATKKKIDALQKKIDELSFSIQNKSDEEISQQENEFIEKQNIDEKIKKASAKYRAELRQAESGISKEQLKEMQKEKREQKTEAKLKKAEDERENFLVDNNIPTTISEFEKATTARKCSDAVVGDVVLFTEGVFSGSFRNAKFEGNRRILGLIEKESYGSNKGQHSFTIYILDSDGEQAFETGETIRRMGRNMYKECNSIQYATQEARDEKHARGESAKRSKYWNWLSEAEYEGKMFKTEKIPHSFIKENWEQIRDSYPMVSSNLNIEKFEFGGMTGGENNHSSLGTAKELSITPTIKEHDMIAECGDCGDKFSYSNSKSNIIWECPECKSMKRIS